MTPNVAKLLMEECCSSGNEDLVQGIVTKLVATTADPSENKRRMDSVLVPLLSQIPSILQGHSKDAPSIPGVAQLYTAALPTLVEQKTRWGLRPEDVGSLVTAATFAGVAALKTIIIPALEKDTRNENAHRQFLRELDARRTEIAPDGTSAADELKIIAKDFLESVLKASHLASVGELLDLCVTLDQLPSCQIILSKYSTPPTTAFSKFLDPAAFHERNKIPRTVPIFADFYKKAVMDWCRPTLGAPPGDVNALLEGVRRISCSCPNCRRLVALFGSNQTTISFDRIGSPAAKHLHQILSAAPKASQVATWQITKHRSPQGFAVAKKEVLTRAVTYSKRQKEGISAVKNISSNETTLRDIFGADYAGLCRLLGVRWFHRQLPALNASVASSRSQGTGRMLPWSTAPLATTSNGGAPSENQVGQQRAKVGRPQDHGSANTQPLAPVQAPTPKRRKIEGKDTPVIDLTSL